MLRTSRRHVLLLALVLTLATTLASAAAPAIAQDKSYTIPSVKIAAQVPRTATFRCARSAPSTSAVRSRSLLGTRHVPHRPRIRVRGRSRSPHERTRWAFVQQDSEDRVPGHYRVANQETRSASMHITPRPTHRRPSFWSIRSSAPPKPGTTRRVLLEVHRGPLGPWCRRRADRRLIPRLGTQESLKVWAHGPLNGNVEPRGNQMLVSVTDLPANKFVRAARCSRARRCPPGSHPRCAPPDGAG